MMIISGYWVGPDIDDGWGFIEAFINRTTWIQFLFYISVFAWLKLKMEI